MKITDLQNKTILSLMRDVADFYHLINGNLLFPNMHAKIKMFIDPQGNIILKNNDEYRRLNLKEATIFIKEYEKFKNFQ